MNASSQSPVHVCVGVFSIPDMVDHAVQRLTDEGLGKKQIEILTTDADIKGQFPDVKTPPPEKSIRKLSLATSTGLPVYSLSVPYLPGLLAGAVGSLSAAFSLRGIRRELADYYDQALGEGKILLAVWNENMDELEEAQRILGEIGERVVPLPAAPDESDTA